VPAADYDAPSRDMEFELLEKSGFVQMCEKPMSLHRQIRSVDLQDHAGVVDSAILVGQCFRQSRQMAILLGRTTKYHSATCC
jgi:hypothetical protein